MKEPLPSQYRMLKWGKRLQAVQDKVSVPSRDTWLLALLESTPSPPPCCPPPWLPQFRNWITAVHTTQVGKSVNGEVWLSTRQAWG